MIQDRLKVALLPLDIDYADPAANLARADATMESLHDDVDIAVLPELFTTAYIKKREKALALADVDNGITVSAVKKWARRGNCAVAGSFLATDGAGQLFNRAFFAEPDGNVTFYDKKHLFSLSGENELFTAGTSRFPVKEFRGWKVMLMVCYDLRFPIWCRNIDLSYDLMIFSANWGGSRAYAFERLLIARAIENQACVAGCNRSGSDAYGEYSEGMSQIFDCMGRPVGTVDNGIVYGTLSMESMKTSRKRFPAYLDVDRITLP